MDDTTTLGAYLRAERQRRDLTLKTISESTKVSLPLLVGLESDDISRWPGGIFRRAFVRSYAEAVGLDPDEIFKRFERQYKPAMPEAAGVEAGHPPAEIVALAQATGVYRWSGAQSSRARYLGTAADMAVALVLAFGSAAGGSRLLWPVLLIAAYYAAGVLLTGTSPMVALLGEAAPSRPSTAPDQVLTAAAADEDVDPILGHSSPRATS
jgi:transcriptional regulator with XRE-family HTH domain